MRALYRPLLADRALVAMTDGRAIQGVITRTLGDLLVLSNATLIVERAQPLPLDGEVVLDRQRIAFIQVEAKTWQ